MKFWLSLTFLLVLASGFALGFLAARQWHPAPESGAVPLQDLYSTVPPYLVTSEDVYKELGLDSIQRERVNALVSRHYRRVKEARGSLVDLARDLREGILAALTPNQRETFQEIQERYSERELLGRVSHDLLKQRAELELTAEQEPLVFQILYDAARERKDLMMSPESRGAPREAMGEKFREIDERMEARMIEVLTEEQAANYTAQREREKRWWAERKERGDRKRGPEGDPHARGGEPAGPGGAGPAGGAPAGGGPEGEKAEGLQAEGIEKAGVGENAGGGGQPGEEETAGGGER